MKQLLSTEQFKKVLPPQFKASVNQELIDQINHTLADPDLYETYRDNLLSYAHVMRDGKFKMVDYIAAIKYCSHKIMGASNIDAFVKTFPDRYQSYVANGTSNKDIASYITAYNKNKLVNLIMEQTIIPSWILNQDLYQKAINIQASIMTDEDVSFKVRSDAANSLMTHLRPPEVQKVELDIGLKKDTAMEDLKATLLDLALKQQQFIEAGVVPIKDVTRQRIVREISHDVDS